MRQSYSLEDVTAAIEGLAARDNLAAVLIQLNDTYLIDERRDSGIPGMARVSGLVGAVRTLVRRLTGEDRTLLLHSGDYLSPSFMGKQFKGRQMVELMNLAGVNFATLGNHEFDFGGEELQARLAEGGHVNVLANLTAPPGYDMRTLVFWPEKDPFLAITGMAGEQTIGKAEKAGFTRIPLEESVKSVLAQVRADPRIGGLVVLSHMDRKEDKQIQNLLSKQWHRSGFVYLLGGHDHDIFWRERDWPNCYLSKCLSNCKSITLFLVPKDGMAAPAVDVISTLRVYPTREEEILLTGSEEEFIAARAEAGAATTLESVLNAWQRIAPVGLRPDFAQAFERRIGEVYGSMYESEIAQEAAYGSLDLYVVGQAAAQTVEGFAGGALEISDSEHLFGLPADPASVRAVETWQGRLIGAADDNLEVVDFSSAAGGRLDAAEKSLRRHSTDFGNFAADAVKLATGADLAMLNSGAFRFDGPVSPRITRKDLREVFIYDTPEAVAIVSMDAGEVRDFYAHARQHGGHGAFLQVSLSGEELEKLSGPLKVALIRHMLVDKEDGYQGLLAALRQTAPERVCDEAEKYDLASGSLLELIAAGVTKGVRYANEIRLVAAELPNPLEEAEANFIRMIDDYRQASARLGIPEPESLDVLAGVTESPVPAELYPIVRRLNQFIVVMMRKNAETRLYDNERGFGYNFYRQLVRSATSFRTDVRYHAYFDHVYTFVVGRLQRRARQRERGPA